LHDAHLHRATTQKSIKDYLKTLCFEINPIFWQFSQVLQNAYVSLNMQNWFFNNLTTMESNDWLDLIHMLASRAAYTWIVLSFRILLWLRWKLTFLLKTESRYEFCKSIFKICYALSKLSIDYLLLFNECI
jgi:hypothetical protein